MTKDKMKRNIMRGIMKLRTKGMVEEDCILDILDDNIDTYIADLEKENAELKKKNEELGVFLCAGSTFNKALNSTNKALEEERDRCRNMMFDQKEQLTKAKELLNTWVELFKLKVDVFPPTPIQVETEQFLKEIDE